MATKPLPDLTGTYIFDPDVVDEIEQSEPTIELESPFGEMDPRDTVTLGDWSPDDDFLDDIEGFSATDVLGRK